jgi:hypothetical protein
MSKYGYSNIEMFFMALITAFTNFSSSHALLMLYKRKKLFVVFLGLFT